MEHTKTRKLVESAIMIALATVLSLLKLADLPYGGSVTLASMLPIALIAYRNGLGWGLGSGLAYGVLQQLLGLKTLTYVTGAGSVIAVILLDYIIAFTVMGLAGIFRRTPMPQAASLTVGVVFSCVLRYICHVISGATVWAGLSIPTTAVLAYSLAYNATYMIPETIVTALAAFYIASLIDFREVRIRRMTREKFGVGGYLLLAGSLLMLAAAIYDIVALFSHMQDPDSGTFNITLIGTSGIWLPVVIVTAAVVLVFAVLLIVGLRLQAKERAGAGDAETLDKQA